MQVTIKIKTASPAKRLIEDRRQLCKWQWNSIDP